MSASVCNGNLKRGFLGPSNLKFEGPFWKSASPFIVSIYNRIFNKGSLGPSYLKSEGPFWNLGVKSAHMYLFANTACTTHKQINNKNSIKNLNQFISFILVGIASILTTFLFFVISVLKPTLYNCFLILIFLSL